MNAVHAILRAPVSGRAWRELAYLIVSLPLAVLAFALVVGTLLPGAVLSLLTIGLVLIALVLHLARGFGAGFRALHRTLLGVAPPAPPWVRTRSGFFGWLADSLRSASGWRALAYCLLRLPFAVVTTYLGLGCWAYGALGFAYPLLRFIDGEANRDAQGVVHYGFTVGRAHFDTWPLALAVSAVGLVILFAAPWVVHGLVLADRFAIRHLLSEGGLSERVRDLERTRALAVDDAAATLRRIERDLHDGAQAKLVALAMDLTMMREGLRGSAPDLDATRALVDAAHGHATQAIGELRDLARGIHPPALDRGLADALQTLAARSPVPTRFTADLPRRPAASIETIAYFCASELLTNVARHSGAGQATMELLEQGDAVLLRVGDDGGGGAGGRPGGTGLAGLADRVHTVDGSLTIDSPPGGPTVVTVRLPLHA